MRRAVRRLLHDAARPAGGDAPRRPRGEGGRAGEDSLRRPEAPPRPRGGARGRPGAAVPRRADNRLRPRREARGLGHHPLAARARQDDPPDDALHRGGTAAGRPRRRPARRSHRRDRHAVRADRLHARDRDPLSRKRRGRRRPDRGADARPERADRARARRGDRAGRARGTAADARGDLPLAHRGGARRMRLFMHELRAQQRLFWRSRELAFFTFLLPIILFFLLGSVYGDDDVEGVRGADYLLSGMLGYGCISTAFAGLAIMLVIRREQGILKRLRATPLPPATYLAAVLTSIVLVFALETVLMISIGRIAFDTALPDRFVSLAIALLLGAVSFAALGVGLSSVIRSAEGASAVVNAIYLPVSFISGAFFSPASFPAFLEAIADVLPLVYFIELVRDVMLYGDRIWDKPTAVAVVAAWGILGLIVSVRSFRWEPRER